VGEDSLREFSGPKSGRRGRGVAGRGRRRN
jgi:hypothetical protein